MEPKRLGLDVGNVLVMATQQEALQDDFLLRKPTDNAFETIASLVQEKIFEPENIFIISACGPDTEQKTKQWFRHHRIFHRVGIRSKNWYFVRHRSDKAPVCRALGITHFVDDRLDVLDNIHRESPRTKLFAFNPRSMMMSLAQWQYITVVNNFVELEAKLKTA
ncbi:hypothetical protein IPM19_04305 [bacterium]|nr:MAG: hypothetical protein IPM19_04305 [bacterium]